MPTAQMRKFVLMAEEFSPHVQHATLGADEGAMARCCLVGL